MKPLRFVALFVAAALLSVVRVAQAQDVPPVDSAGPAAARGEPDAGEPDDAPPLESITVSGARGPRLDLNVPASITVMDSEEVRIRHPPRNLPELLNRVPGVSTQETGPAQGSPFIRGLTGYHVLTLIDGIRLNGSFFRSGPNQYNALIDPLLIDRVEVLRGPGSVLYGSDALGGVIALKTRDPAPFKPLKPGVETWGQVSAYTRWAQSMRDGGEGAWRPRIEVSGGTGPVSAMVGFDYNSIGDREGGQHQKTLHNTSYAVGNGDAKVVYRVTEQDTLRFAIQRTELRNGPRTHSTVASESYRGTTVGSDSRRDIDQSRQLAYVQLESVDRGPFDRIKASVSWQRQYENQHRYRTKNRTKRSGFDINTLGAFVEAESDLPLPVDATLNYGFDYTHDFVVSFETNNGVPRTRGPIADNANYDLFGTYVRLELSVASIVDAYVGVRYSLARIVAKDVDPDPTDALPFGLLSETYDAFIGSTGFALHLTDTLSLVGSASQGFRAPNLDDTTSFRAVATNSFDSPSPDVDPETSITLETGLKWRTDWIVGQAFYAYTFLKDLIQRVPTGNTVSGLTEFTKANFSDGAIQALDGETELLWDPLAERLGLDMPKLGLSLLLRGSWVRGDADALVNGVRQKDPMRRIPPARFATIIRWTEPEDGWLWAEVEAVFVGQQKRLSVGDKADTQRIPARGSPGYSLWHARVGFELAEGRLRGSVGVENIFDRDHRVHGSGTNGPGRTLVVALEAHW